MTSVELIETSNTIQTFQLSNDQAVFNITAYNFMGEIYFRGKEIALALDYKNTKAAVIDHVDSDDKISFGELKEKINGSENAAPDIPTGIQPQTIFITEPGLYSLILNSKLPSAKIFKKWVFSEVLPSIRKTGSYSLNQELVEVGKTLTANSYQDVFENYTQVIQSMIYAFTHSNQITTTNLTYVYISYLGTDKGDDNIPFHHFKFGKTTDWVERKKKLSSEFKGEFFPIFLKPYSVSAETEFKKFLIFNDKITTYKNFHHTEVFYVNEDFSIKDAIDHLDRVGNTLMIEHRTRDHELYELQSQLKLEQSEKSRMESELAKVKAEFELYKYKTESEAKINNLTKQLEGMSIQTSNNSCQSVAPKIDIVQTPPDKTPTTNEEVSKKPITKKPVINKIQTKTCGDCQQSKSVDNFYKRADLGPGSYTTYCKPCSAIRVRNHRRGIPNS